MSRSINKIFEGLAIFIFYIIAIQDLVASFLYHLNMPFLLIKLVLLSKEALILVVGLSIFLRGKISTVSFSLVVFALYALVFVFFTERPFSEAMAGYRTYALLLLGFLAGERIRHLPEFTPKFLLHAQIILFSISLFGLLELFVLPNSLWKDTFPIMEMKREVANIKGEEYFDTGMPVNAYGELTRRLLGPFDEPLYMAYFTVILTNFFISSLIVFSKNKWDGIQGSVIIFLTQTRAIIIGYIFSILFVAPKRTKFKVTWLLAIALIMILIPVIIVVYQDWFLTLVNSVFSKSGRNIAHLDAYATGLSNLLESPFGQGIGTSSTLAGFMNRTNSLSTENAFINIGIEIGIIGLVWFFLFLLGLGIRFYFALSSKRIMDEFDKVVVTSALMLTLQFIFAGLVAPHILTARILIPFAFILGWANAIATVKPSITKSLLFQKV